jgi:hypothetical protein
VQALKQPVIRVLVRGILVTAVSTCSLAVWAQGTNQGSAQGSAVAPAKSSVAPPPADLEPGVNTSAIQPSSPDPTPAPVPAPKPAQTSGKRAPGSGPSATTSRATSGATAGAANGATAGSSAAASAAAGAASGAANGSTAGATSGAAGGGTSTPARGARTTTAAASAGATPPKNGAPAGKAHDSIELDTTQITGNRELPKVLYIVPWKRSDLGDLVGKPVNSLLDEVLTPVDRDVFKRQNRYYDALKPDDAKDAAGAAAAGVNEKH